VFIHDDNDEALAGLEGNAGEGAGVGFAEGRHMRAHPVPPGFGPDM